MVASQFWGRPCDYVRRGEKRKEEGMRGKEREGEGKEKEGGEKRRGRGREEELMPEALSHVRSYLQLSPMLFAGVVYEQTRPLPLLMHSH